ncbi:hypothetical protein [Leptobacterium flavescens]|uniref:hypothetical protein n=1 Tax=Leptobacterium flavescens TaxID=472055 RepID=UPI001953857B|nr:hypothetical protein [Leptobacterium flavescens]
MTQNEIENRSDSFNSGGKDYHKVPPSPTGRRSACCKAGWDEGNPHLNPLPPGEEINVSKQ